MISIAKILVIGSSATALLLLLPPWLALVFYSCGVIWVIWRLALRSELRKLK